MDRVSRLSKRNWTSSWTGCSESRKRTPINHCRCDNIPSRRGTNPASIECSAYRRWLHNAPASNSIQDTEEILLELCTQSRNLCSSAAVSVIQYGIPSLSRRAVSNRCSIQ